MSYLVKVRNDRMLTELKNLRLQADKKNRIIIDKAIELRRRQIRDGQETKDFEEFIKEAL
jgi:hypothetical protein